MTPKLPPEGSWFPPTHAILKKSLRGTNLDILHCTFIVGICQPFMNMISSQNTVCRKVGGSVDGRLLAAFVRGKHGEKLAELGAGCGDVAIQVVRHCPGVWVDALEIQTDLVDLARLQVAEAGVSEWVRIIPGDVRQRPTILPPATYDGVFCNPPFFKLGEGRLPPSRVRAQARFELSGNLEDFIQCAEAILRPGGEFYLVHRPERAAEILSLLHASHLQPLYMIPVHNQLDQSAIRILIRSCKGGQGNLKVGPIQTISPFAAY